MTFRPTGPEGFFAPPTLSLAGNSKRIEALSER